MKAIWFVQKRFNRTVSLKEKLGRPNFTPTENLKSNRKDTQKLFKFDGDIDSKSKVKLMGDRKNDQKHMDTRKKTLNDKNRSKVEKPNDTERSKPKISIQNGISVRNLSQKLSIPVGRMIQKIKDEFGISYSEEDIVNQELSNLLILEFNETPLVVEDIDIHKRPEPVDWSKYSKRNPIVTIMGHVDHGKTTLLDTLRKSSVAENEFGGITQHIGAFVVHLKSGSEERGITFLDTPGHAAFSQMRKRGAQVTDIVVLVVASDDGVMPQTIEAIKHTLESEVPMIVAVNKCDKPGTDKEKILADLLNHNVMVESMGGDIPSVCISGKTGLGINELEETILAVADICDYRGDDTGLVEGVIIESKIVQGLGNAATVIVKRGTLKPGCVIVAGNTWCKVKRLMDDTGKIVKSTGPSTPVEVFGWKELPAAGDEVLEANNENLCKQVVADRKRRADLQQSFKNIEMINQKKALLRKALEDKEKGIETQPTREEGPQIKTYNAILRGDVHGSLEAIEGALSGLPSHKVKYHTISSSVGAVTESDVELAHSTGAEIISFNMPLQRSVASLARSRDVAIHCHNVIYHLIDQVKESMAELLDPEIITHVDGEALVQALFTITVKKKPEVVAGCKVQVGKIMRNQSIRVVRNGEIIHEGKIKTFKHHKKDILEAQKGLECGIAVEEWNEVKEGDIIQCISTTQRKQTIQ